MTHRQMESMSRSVHVGNIPQGITQEMLSQIFAQLGPVNEVRIGTNGKYAFIDYESNQSAQMALSLNGMDIAGCQIVEKTGTQKLVANDFHRSMESGDIIALVQRSHVWRYSVPQYAHRPSQTPRPRRLRVEMAKTPKLSQSGGVSIPALAMNNIMPQSAIPGPQQAAQDQYAQMYRCRG